MIAKQKSSAALLNVRDIAFEKYSEKEEDDGINQLSGVKGAKAK